MLSQKRWNEQPHQSAKCMSADNLNESTTSDMTYIYNKVWHLSGESHNLEAESRAIVLEHCIVRVQLLWLYYTTQWYLVYDVQKLTHRAQR